MTLADPALLDTLRHPVDAAVRALAGALASFVDHARDDVQSQLDRRVYRTVDLSVPGDRPFTENPSLRRLNLALALAADVLMAAVVLVASLRSMLEHSVRSRYELAALIPKLLLAIVLVHFSLPFVQMAIDLDNALCAVVVSLGDEMTVAGMPWAASVSPDTVQHISAASDLFRGVFSLCVVIALVILVLAYILRHALLTVLVVCAPMAALCTALPMTHGYSRTWLRLFTVTVFMQAVQLLILRVATVVAVSGDAGVGQALEALATLFLMLKVPGALNEAAHLETKAESMARHLEKGLRRAAVRHLPHHATRTRRSAA